MHLLIHLFAARRQAHMGSRHHDTSHGNGADKLKWIQVLLILKRGTFHAHQHVNGYTLGMLRQVSQLLQQAGPVGLLLAHAHDTATTDLHAGIAHVVQCLQAILIGAGSNNIAIVFGGGIQVVVVIVQPGLSQLAGLLLGQHAQGHAAFQAQITHAFDHGYHVRHVSLLGTAPGSPHTEARGPTGNRRPGLLQYFLHLHQFFYLQPRVVTRTLRAIGTVFRTSAGFDGK